MTMKPRYLLFFLLAISFEGAAQTPARDTVPVWGACFGIPEPESADKFIRFVEEELIPAGINTLILRIDYNFDYKTHPELSTGKGWPQEKTNRLVGLCMDSGVNIVPSLNLLGHQSWASLTGRLLEVFPEFDETPGITVPSPEDYKWPNPDGLYCKSYCPNHPDVHKVIFACVDELTEAFGATDFHAGMDEVFYIAHPDCPRCVGLDPSVVFAGEVNFINAYLKSKGVRTWIWGDRLIDGSASGLGEWCASMNGTWPAVDMIDRDVLICDWQYVRAHPTPPYFALKGFDVLTCGHQRPEVTRRQIRDLEVFRSGSPEIMKHRFRGFVLTVWTSFDNFHNDFTTGTDREEMKASNSFHVMKEMYAAGEVILR